MASPALLSLCLWVAAALVAATASPTPAAAAPARTTRTATATATSILFIQCDEMDGRLLDPASPLSHIVRLPNLARLAARGTVLTSGYTPNPLCAPSRAAMFTGRYTSSIRAFSNVKALTADVRNPSEPDPYCAKLVGYGAEWCVAQGRLANVTSTINLAFEAAGFDVQLFGKMDTGGGPAMLPPTTYGTGYHDTGNWSTSGKQVETYYPGDVLHTWARSANISRAALAPLEGPNTWINDDNAKGGPFPKDWQVVDGCTHYLASHGHAGADTTSTTDTDTSKSRFFLYCSFLNPHPPYYSNKTFEAYINQTALNASLAVQKTNWRPQAELHPAVRYSSVTEGVQDAWDGDLTYRMNLAYYGQVAQTDFMVGKILDALEASGRADSTLVLFTSDHGEERLQHQLVEKMSMYEGSARVPMVVAGPGVRQGAVVRNLTSLLDIFPTFLDAAGLPVFEFLNGQSMVPLFTDAATAAAAAAAQPRRDFVVSEFLGDEANTGQFMVRHGDWKLVVYGQDAPYQDYIPQLFDLSADPDEMDNVAAANPGVVAKLKQLLNTQIEYVTVNREVDAEGRECAKRWLASYTTEQADSLLKAAYKGFDDTDRQKFMAWLNRE